MLQLPQKYDPVKNSFTFFGCFCSFECMKTYNLELNDSFTYKRFAYISILAESTFGTKSTIMFAPNKHNLAMFGGTMSIEEFRKNSKPLPSGYTHSCETVVHTECAPVEKNVVASYNPTPVSNEPLKLQRNKPLKNTQNTLEKTMGLFASISK